MRAFDVIFMPIYDYVEKIVLKKLFPNPVLCKIRDEYREFCAEKRLLRGELVINERLK